MPGATCSVASCRSRFNKAKDRRESLMFFRFPKDPVIQKEWVQKCYRKDEFNPKNLRICSNHFKPSDFEDEVQGKLMGFQAKILKKDAVPSLLLLAPEDETPETVTQRSRNRCLQKDNEAIVKDRMHDMITLTPRDVDYIEPNPESLKSLKANTFSNIKTIEISEIASSSKESDLDILKRKLDELQNENAILKKQMSKYEMNEKNITTKMNNLEQQLMNDKSEFKEEVQVASNYGTEQVKMPGCAAVGCPNSAKKGFAMKRFPKDPKRRQEWADRLKRGGWSPTDWSTLCEVHFRPEMWEIVREDGTKKLKRDAVPTIFNATKAGLKRKVPYELELQSPASSSTSVASESAENIKLESNSSVGSTLSLKMEQKSSVSNTDESIPNSPESMEEEGELLTNDTEFSNILIIEPNESPITLTNTICRICLETKPQTSLLNLNEEDGRNIYAVFQEVLGEASEQIYDSKMPPQICEICLYHLDHAYKFKKMYGETLRILEDSLSKESKKDASVEDKYYNSTLCRICLDPDAELPFSLELTLDDGSTLNVVQIFEELTGVTDKQIYDSKMPQRICDKCPDSLVYAYSFKKAFENSTQILRNSISKTESVSETIDSALEDLDEEFDQVDEDLSETEEIEVENKLIKMEEKQIWLHSCPICFKKFSALELKQHCRSHYSLKPYFKVAPVYNGKIRFYAKPRNNMCLFYRENVLHTCPFCLQAFAGKDFRNHIKTHKVDGNFKCKVCDRKFLGRNHLKRHQLMHRKEPPFRCKECGKGFFLKKNFDFHQFLHSTPTQLPFPCKYCSKSFANPDHLKRHNFTHEKSMSYKKYYPNKQNILKCKQCLQKFKNQVELEEHKCTLICAKCVKPFRNKKELLNHGCKAKRLHYVCGCGKEFLTLSSCKGHVCKTKKRPKTLCSICGQRVVNLKQHMLRHFPEKRTDTYMCDICGKIFKYKESVWRHKASVHKPPATFNCQYCNKTFGNKIYMRSHEKIHTRKKNHICEVCGLRFLYKVYLTRHQKVHKYTTESEEESDIVLSH